MKIKITLIVVSLSSLFAFSQTVLELDKKNGFKDFILGDTFYKWQNQLNLIKVNDDENKTYLYKGDC